ncbi:Ankyrin repeat protein [Mycena chlorophos]|uniref:Ankyrin repeat protein n=1 Tax=Mycena chlorophos TaxID=658473 RepID=A0A8H6TL20_MYCCL|nr:Ankyrin repeat protein [Mycena chlorophos]
MKWTVGGTGGGGGAGGQYGGAGGVGQGPTVYINADNVNFPSAPSEDYYLLMDFASSLNFLPQQQEIYETWQKGTGGWFLEHPDFLDWVSGPTKLLWCAGIPGSGKTVLA